VDALSPVAGRQSLSPVAVAFVGFECGEVLPLSPRSE